MCSVRENSGNSKEELELVSPSPALLSCDSWMLGERRPKYKKILRLNDNYKLRTDKKRSKSLVTISMKLCFLRKLSDNLCKWLIDHLFNKTLTNSTCLLTQVIKWVLETVISMLVVLTVKSFWEFLVTHFRNQYSKVMSKNLPKKIVL